MSITRRPHTAPTILFTLSLLTALSVLPTPNSINAQAAPLVRVVRVIDGDTIEVCCIGWKRESIRYIGMDTPETHHCIGGFLLAPIAGRMRHGSESQSTAARDLRGTPPRLPEALRRVLVWKGLLTNKEVLEAIKAVRRELEGKCGPSAFGRGYTFRSQLFRFKLPTILTHVQRPLFS